MLRRFALALTLVLALAACATAPADTSAPDVPPAVAAPSSTSGSTVPNPGDGTTSSTNAVAEEPAETMPRPPVPDGPAAPDFTLALGDGRSFTLSDEAQPVFMIFWAEW